MPAGIRGQASFCIRNGCGRFLNLKSQFMFQVSSRASRTSRTISLSAGSLIEIRHIPVEYFTIFFLEFVQIGGYLIAMRFQLFLFDLYHFVFPALVLVLVSLQKLTTASGVYPTIHLPVHEMTHVGSHLLGARSYGPRQLTNACQLVRDDDCNAIYQ